MTALRGMGFHHTQMCQKTTKKWDILFHKKSVHHVSLSCNCTYIHTCKDIHIYSHTHTMNLVKLHMSKIFPISALTGPNSHIERAISAHPYDFFSFFFFGKQTKHIYTSFNNKTLSYLIWHLNQKDVKYQDSAGNNYLPIFSFSMYVNPIWCSNPSLYKNI